MPGSQDPVGQAELQTSPVPHQRVGLESLGWGTKVIQGAGSMDLLGEGSWGPVGRKTTKGCVAGEE